MKEKKLNEKEMMVEVQTASLKILKEELLEKKNELEEKENVVKQQATSLKNLREELSEKESKIEERENTVKEQKKELEEKGLLWSNNRQLHWKIWQKNFQRRRKS